MTRVNCVSLEPMNVMIPALVIDRKSSSTAGRLEHSVSRLGFKEHKAAQYLKALPQSQAVCSDFKKPLKVLWNAKKQEIHSSGKTEIKLRTVWIPGNIDSLEWLSENPVGTKAAGR